MIINLPTGISKLNFFLDDFEVTLKYSLTSNHYNAWVKVGDQTIVEAKGLTVGTDLLEDTHYNQKISTVDEASINAKNLQINYQR